MKEYEYSLQLMGRNVKNVNLRKHMLSCAAAMEALARLFNEDTLLWKTVGILHDIDYELTSDDFSFHGIRGKQLLKEEGYSDTVCDAVEAHVGNTPRETKLKKAIYSVDPLTGIIVACALIRPEKKLGPLDVEFVKKRMTEKRFAANASRQPIYDSVELGITMEEFIGTVLDSMKGISADLGL